MRGDKTRRCLFIFHFNPLELYPPVMNDIYYLEETLNKRIFVVTTAAADTDAVFRPAKAQTKIYRLGKTGKRTSSFTRLFTYLYFYGAGFLHLLVRRPSAVLYFETFSSLSPIWYKRFVNRSAKLFIHYHEYMTLNDYRNGRHLVKRLHRLEQNIYPSAAWISHTNEKRLELFLADNPKVDNKCAHVVPNYPPRQWATIAKHAAKSASAVLRIVYAGSFNLRDMYTKEFASWVQQQGGKVIWDIYGLNMDNEAIQFLQELNCPHIRNLPATYYYQLPDVYRNYDVGVILYKGISDNHVYSVSNKFFEYHVCGLDIWFPKEIITSLEYVTSNTYPKILALDYTQIQNMSCEELIDRRGMQYKTHAFFIEEALRKLSEHLQVA